LKSVRVADEAKNLYPDGAYQSSTDKTSKDVGNIPLKLQNVLNHLQNNDTLKLDFTIEAGLGTIWASANAYSQDSNNYSKPVIYDDTYNYNLGQNDKTLLYDTTGSGQAWSNGPGADYLSIADQFVSLANDTRKDHVFIADPIRHLLVRGANNKVSGNSGFVFSDDIYWPLNNQFSSIESSYVVTYANWLKYNDAFSNQFVWLPSSGYVAAKIATSSQQNFPWSAVAGFTRGVLSNVVDIAINPTQKQRDLLYKVNLNPIAYFPNEGYVIYGQKTLYRLPSAFDRLNVRELFLVLEKTTQSLLKYFVFEPNTFTTQKRLVASLTPVFDNAKINGGLYDYLIVCDSRNNPPNVVDNNELAVAIYIQPVKTAEFILCDFIATQTGVNFNELVANKQF
jgi:phage tail sheath protein FI